MVLLDVAGEIFTVLAELQDLVDQLIALVADLAFKIADGDFLPVHRGDRPDLLQVHRIQDAVAEDADNQDDNCDYADQNIPVLNLLAIQAGLMLFCYVFWRFSFGHKDDLWI